MIMICTSFSYTPTTPAGYVCSNCGVKNCKLWRQYNYSADQVELKCAKCSGEDINTLDQNGTVESSFYKRGEPVTIMETGKVGFFGEDVPMPRTDQLGNLIPAVPTEEGDTFWGYTSTPDAGVAWWKSLPSQGVTA